MAWVDDGQGNWVWRDDGTGEGALPPLGSLPPDRTPGVTSAAPADINAEKAKLDPNSPTYAGPGYRMGKNGRIELPGDASTLVDYDLWVARQNNPVPTTNEYLEQGQEALAGLQTPTGTNPNAALAAFQGAAPLTTGRAATRGAPRENSQLAGVDTRGVTADTLSTAGNVAPPGARAPEVDTERINKLTGGLDTYRTALWEMSQDNTGLSAAEAQLRRATEMANIQAGINTEASQRSALGGARSARNRGDRALLERQAVGEAGYIGQDAARTAALTEAQARGDLAELRAKEEDADRTFRLQALKEAANLGLNTAALELDISKANLDSANNWINNEFAREGLQMQLDQQQTEAVMGFTRDMAALQFQYDQMGVEDQNETDRLLMQKYGIDQSTMVALKQLKASKEIDWSGIATALVGGAASGATAAIAKSDERAKTNIQEVESTAAELDELMGALGAYEYEYKEPDKDGHGLRFGFMAQELEKTRLGKHMVKPDREGFKTVEIAPLALATASGLALVSERLKALEEAVK